MNERSVFAAALEITDPAARAAYLDEACGHQPGLRAHFDELLAAHEKLGSFLDRPPLLPQGTQAYEPEGVGPGSQIGPYKLLQQIGEGGMGVVYMAEQEQPVRRQVALKVIKSGLDSAQVLARFEAERQALALMDHPNIAKVLDAGTTASGRPYFVMELVKGIPITQFCDENQLTPRAPGAVHPRLPRGPARPPEGRHPPRPQALQRAGGAVRRPAGAEGDRLRRGQGDGRKADRADAVHGVRLVPRHAGVHEPRAGQAQRPGRGHAQRRLRAGRAAVRAANRQHAARTFRLKQAALDELLRIIREEEPPRPSTRLSQSGEALATISARRGTEPAKLGQVLRGELDWIVMKALEKDRTRRYETANGLARDVERYLHDEPVEACPPTAGYKLRKFARKNKRLLVTVAAFAALLLLGVAASTWQAVRATQAEAVANANAVQAQEKEEEANQ